MIGDVGTLTGTLEYEWPIWHLVTSKIATLPELRSGDWDWEDIDKAMAVMEMRSDYEAAFQAYLDSKYEQGSK